MSKARDLANAGTALGAVTATELAYVDGVTSAIQTQIDTKEATLPSQTGNSGKYLTTNGSAKSWGTVSQYALPSQTGNSGKYLTTNGTAESWGTVTVPTSWIARTAAVGVGFNTVEYNGSNLWVAAGESGKLWTSPDATTWTERTSDFSTTRINSLAYGNGIWVAVGGVGKISSSTDGVTWTARTSNMSTNAIESVIYANSLFVAVGAGGGTDNTGGITYSSDGITWTRKSQSVSVDSQYYDVVYNGTNWIVVAYSNGTNNYIYASTPSGTWTAASTGRINELNGRVIWDGTRHITIERSPYYKLYYGPAGNIIGSTTQYGSSPSANGAGGRRYSYFYNGQIYITNGILLNIVTPGATSFSSMAAPILLPTYGDKDGAGNSTILAGSGALWAGSQGIIWAGLTGIFTSF